MYSAHILLNGAAESTVLISPETDGSREVIESPEAFPATCARARFAGCTFMRHIILAINTVQCLAAGYKNLSCLRLILLCGIFLLLV